MLSNVENTEKSRDELLDEALTNADGQTPEQTGAPNQEPAAHAAEQNGSADVGEQPAKTAGEPKQEKGDPTDQQEGIDTKAILAKNDELAKAIESMTKERDDLARERDGLSNSIKRVRGKARTYREQLAQTKRQLEEFNASRPEPEDPLKVWRKNPENEGIAPPDEVLQAHDDFLISNARRPQTPKPADVKQSAAAVDQALARAKPEERWLVQAAVNNGWVTHDDIVRMAQSPDPAKAAVEISREYFEDEGTPEDLAIIDRFFPKSQPSVGSTLKEQTQDGAKPAQRQAPDTGATGARRNPAPQTNQQKPKDQQSDEAEYEPQGFGPNHRAISGMFFPPG